ncbi:hypothetical protein BO71DRAFT_403873 [Aspergillus ellipticus CBS 707.79]|uniref:Uncharacterized protein n=1 Tax=Aspergillus ellipticus CBS 707.79 TaxID=1448320 RepID=A0A319CV36_9EURO|nr:hypothetical protein BO71DRAFT_403873 [Aspergillus ellipticus CBS 707.79]
MSKIFQVVRLVGWLYSCCSWLFERVRGKKGYGHGLVSLVLIRAPMSRFKYPKLPLGLRVFLFWTMLGSYLRHRVSGWFV